MRRHRVHGLAIIGLIGDYMVVIITNCLHLLFISVPIAEGKTSIKYNKPDNNMVSFPQDIKVIIFGRTEDNKLLDIEVIHRLITCLPMKWIDLVMICNYR